MTRGSDLTDAEARAICIAAGYSPLNVDLLCRNAFDGDWQAFARSAQEPDFDGVEDEYNNVLGS